MVTQLSLITSVLLASTTTVSSQPTSTALTSTNLISTITATLTKSGHTTTTTSTYDPYLSLMSSASSLPSASSNSSGSQISSLANAKPQTTVSLFNACSGSEDVCSSINSITYYGAVLSADATKTAYKLDCAKYAGNVTQCFPTPMTVTQGASVFARSDANGITPVTISCNILDTTKSAVCEQKMSKTAGIASAASTGFPANPVNGSVSISTLTFGASQIHYNNLIITSGAAKLSSATATATNTPKTPTSAGTVSSPTKTGGAMVFAPAPSAAVAGVVAIMFAVFAY